MAETETKPGLQDQITAWHVNGMRANGLKFGGEQPSDKRSGRHGSKTAYFKWEHRQERMNTHTTFCIDFYYRCLLMCAAVSVIGVAGWHISMSDEGNGYSIFQSFSFRNPLAFGLTIMALFTLISRIVFARCYVPCPPVEDALLPYITIIIPAYNEGAQVYRTVQSIMVSRYPKGKMDVICVDDGSQDDTWAWMIKARETFGTRIHLIRQPVNRGKRQALLAAFMKAKGSVFVSIDSDSEVLPDTLRHLISPLAINPWIGAVAGNVRVLNLAEGSIPKMMDVSFTAAFDFVRSGQSVYGGVFCTPGALSAYRAEAVKPWVNAWVHQTFMGVRANIGEDRAMTNLILKGGYRVVYQREAVVLTKMPVSYGGLQRMLLRWARSNVRENLVMVSFVLRCFRKGHGGSGWVRLFCVTQMIRMTMGEAFKVALLTQMLLFPLETLLPLVAGGLISAILPAVVHQWRHGGWFGWRWAIPYSFFWLFGLSWISLWGLLTAPNSGWLTRGMPRIAQSPPPTIVIPPAKTA